MLYFFCFRLFCCFKSCFKYDTGYRSCYSFGCNCCFASFRKYSLKWSFFSLWLYPGCGFSLSEMICLWSHAQHKLHLKWWHKLKRIIQQCLQFVYFIYFRSGSSIERVSYLILIRMSFIVWLLYFLSCVTLSSYPPTLSLCSYLVSIQLK